MTVIINGSTGINSPEYAGSGAGILPTSISSSYTLTLNDNGKSIDFSGLTGQAITIPDNATVAFPVGATINITNTSSNQLSIEITTDTLRQAGTTLTGTRTLSAYGLCVLRKVSATTWFVTGAGLA